MFKINFKKNKTIESTQNINGPNKLFSLNKVNLFLKLKYLQISDMQIILIFLECILY